MDAAYRELSVEFPKQCESIRDETHRFAREIMRPAAMKIDRMADPHAVVASDSPLWPVMKAAYGLGYHRAPLPKRFGAHIQRVFWSYARRPCESKTLPARSRASRQHMSANRRGSD